MQEVQLKTRLATSVEQFFVKQIEGQGSRILAQILYILSFGYAFGAWLHRVISSPFSKRVNIASICVGNIIAGGSGKTSFVMKLCEDLSSQVKLCVHSKGYKSGKKSLREVKSIEDGDEAYLMKKSLQNTTVYASKSRYRAARHAEQKSFDAIIFDDGLQNYEIDYSLRLAMLNSSCLFGNARYLPAGYLRAAPSSLKNMDYVAVLGACGVKQVEKIIGKEVIALEYKIKNSSEFAQKKVALFYGLGQPHQFVESVRSLVDQIVLEKRLVDHSSMSQAQFVQFEAAAKKLGADLILCTKKDAVKIKRWPGVVPLVAVEACLEVVSQNGVYEKLLDGILEQVKKNRK